MARVRLCCAVSLFVFVSTSPYTHAQSQDEATLAKQFIGMWRLVSFPVRLADGTMRQNPVSAAYLIYTDTNRMCYVGMNPSRPKWNIPPEGNAFTGGYTPTKEEVDSAFTGSLAYCATVEVHAKEGFVLVWERVQK